MREEPGHLDCGLEAGCSLAGVIAGSLLWPEFPGLTPVCPVVSHLSAPPAYKGLAARTMLVSERPGKLQLAANGRVTTLPTTTAVPGHHIVPGDTTILRTDYGKLDRSQFGMDSDQGPGTKSSAKEVQYQGYGTDGTWIFKDGRRIIWSPHGYRLLHGPGRAVGDQEIVIERPNSSGSGLKSGSSFPCWCQETY